MQGRAVEQARLSKPELKHVLGFEVLDEIDGFLKRHSVFEPMRLHISSASSLDQLGLGGVVMSLPIQDHPIAAERVAYWPVRVNRVDSR